MTRARRVGAVVAGALTAVVLAAAPAAAENPVLDAEGDTDLASALTEAQQVQGVCYGYALQVSDGDTGQFSGTFASSSTGPGRRAAPSADCPRGVVELQAAITYTSDFSEAEDSASWTLRSTLDGDLGIADVERLTGGSASDLLDDGRSEAALLNAVLALPGLASERAGVPPLVLDPNTDPLPADARPTGTPGSDWLRQNGPLLALCGLLVGGGVATFVLARREPGRRDPWGRHGGPTSYPPPGPYAEPEPRTLGPRPRRLPSQPPPSRPPQDPRPPSAPPRGNPA